MAAEMTGDSSIADRMEAFIKTDDVEGLEAFIESKRNIESRMDRRIFSDMESGLVLATKSGADKCLSYILEAGISSMPLLSDAFTIAIENDRLECIKILIEIGGIKVTKFFGTTRHLARLMNSESQKGFDYIIKIHLRGPGGKDLGARLLNEAYEKCTPDRFQDKLNTFIEADRQIVYNSMLGSLKYENLNFVKVLLKAYGSLTGDHEMLFAALVSQNIDPVLVDMLLEAGSEVSPADADPALVLLTRTRLMDLDQLEEIDAAKAEVVTTLIAHGADVNATASKPGRGPGMPALYYAIENGLHQTSDVLIKNGTRIDPGLLPQAGGFIRFSPLYCSIASMNLTAFDALLHAGFNPDGIQGFARPVEQVISIVSDCVHQILPYRRTVATLRLESLTPTEVMDKSLYVLKALLKSGANVNGCYVDGSFHAYVKNPLLEVVNMGLSRHTKCLLLAGGDTSVVRLKYQDPEDSARVSSLPSHLMEAATNPSNLSGFARIIIVQSVTYRRLGKLHQLPLPTSLRKFLQFPDLDDV